ncbi:YoaK family protein [Amycolatopsis sp. NPDC059027]|uniref:YoaK family protein n=1 Tax=unclassified Amycolatopsis TaxID=2618356 RepID=UPI003672F660
MNSGRITAGTLRLAALLAVAGGFLDSFTFVAHGGVFANAQTGNVVLLGVFAARGDGADALSHLPPLLAFVAGVAVAETVTHPRVAPWLRRPLRVALLAEIVVLAVIGFLPDSFSSTTIVLIVSFVAALQNSTFGKLGDWAVNTTMTTGNLRTATKAAYRAVFREEPGAAAQARAFGAICLSFLAGAGLGALVTAWLGNRAAWGAALLLCAGMLLFVLDERPRQSR